MKRMGDWRVLTAGQEEEWDRLIRSFSQWDIYYLCAYARSLQLHGDGEPLLFYLGGETARLCYVAMKSDVANGVDFQEWLPKGKFYDLETPYGYGGLLQEGEVSPAMVAEFFERLTKYCALEGIVSQFYRFHPLLQNQDLLAGASEYRTDKQTVYMDLSTDGVIFDNLDPKNRNMIRKAKKNGVEIFVDRGENVSSFIEIYNETMERNHALDYYYFDRSYFDFLIEHMGENLRFFYAGYKDKIISASMILFNRRFMHYHLSGTLAAYGKLAPTNLLLYEAALWGRQRGIARFHLGGGIGADDSLFRFKKSFNRRGYLDFYIGRTVFLPESYAELLRLRKQHDPGFETENTRLIQYRA